MTFISPRFASTYVIHNTDEFRAMMAGTGIKQRISGAEATVSVVKRNWFADPVTDLFISVPKDSDAFIERSIGKYPCMADKLHKLADAHLTLNNKQLTALRKLVQALSLTAASH